MPESSDLELAPGKPLDSGFRRSDGSGSLFACLLMWPPGHGNFFLDPCICAIIRCMIAYYAGVGYPRRKSWRTRPVFPLLPRRANRARLAQIAALFGMNLSTVINEALDQYIDLHEWQLKYLREGRGSGEAG